MVEHELHQALRRTTGIVVTIVTQCDEYTRFLTEFYVLCTMVEQCIHMHVKLPFTPPCIPCATGKQECIPNKQIFGGTRLRTAEGHRDPLLGKYRNKRLEHVLRMTGGGSVDGGK